MNIFSQLTQSFRSKVETPSIPGIANNIAGCVLVDLRVRGASIDRPPIRDADSPSWRRLEKDLFLNQNDQRKAYLDLKLLDASKLTTETTVVTDIQISETAPDPRPGSSWVQQGGCVWLEMSKFTGSLEQIVGAVDVLFGHDAVDPRPGWTLMRPPLQLDSQPDIPAARLTIFRGVLKPDQNISPPVLRAHENGRFKTIQFSDFHMGVGPGKCLDAVDAHGRSRGPCEADPLTVEFVRRILKEEKPDLAILAGDQVHHDVHDSLTPLLKAVAPFVEAKVPFACVFGNHDSEGPYALSREQQMSILQTIPFNVSEPGPAEVDGVGNYCVEVLAPQPSRFPILTFYLLDSHGELKRTMWGKALDLLLHWGNDHDRYDNIKDSQIDWFEASLEENQQKRKKIDNDGGHLSIDMHLQHIPMSVFKDQQMFLIGCGERREPTEGPREGSERLYTVLQKGGVLVSACGHDHLNDFVAVSQSQQPPFLCYGGGAGYGGYGAFGGKSIARRVRVFAAEGGQLKTWMRLDDSKDRVDEFTFNAE